MGLTILFVIQHDLLSKTFFEMLSIKRFNMSPDGMSMEMIPVLFKQLNRLNEGIHRLRIKKDSRGRGCSLVRNNRIDGNNRFQHTSFPISNDRLPTRHGF